MSTALTHAALGFALGRFFAPGERRPAFWVLAAALPAVPDLDVVAFRFGIPYEAPLGHRGATHSLAFAAAAGIATGALVGRGALDRARLAAFFSLATASHGLVDMLTDGGHGIGLFWPISNDRRFWPVTPLRVPPIGIAGMLSPWGAEVVLSELLWIWLPAGALLAVRELLRRRR